MRWSDRKVEWSFWLLVLLGVGAFFGGYGLLMDPSGANLGMDEGMLHYGPFDDFFFPGLFLLVVIGLGSLLLAFLLYRGSRSARQGVFWMGAILLAWLLVQVLVLWSLNWLHAIYTVWAAVLILLGRSMKERDRAF